MVRVGVEAAAAAEAKDPDRVLEVGEQVYNVCLACHTRYIAE
jgi:cytochrome c5